MVDLWTIWEMTLGPYVEQLGSFFWIGVVFLFSAIIYIRLDDFGPAFMIFAVGFLVLYPVIPAGEYWGGAFIIVTVGIAYSLYRFLVKGLLRG